MHKRVALTLTDDAFYAVRSPYVWPEATVLACTALIQTTVLSKAGEQVKAPFRIVQQTARTALFVGRVMSKDLGV